MKARGAALGLLGALLTTTAASGDEAAVVSNLKVTNRNSTVGAGHRSMSFSA